MDNLQHFRRTDYCGTFTAANVGQEIKMPSAGQTTDEATIVKVNVKVGDTVKRGDELLGFTKHVADTICSEWLA